VRCALHLGVVLDRPLARSLARELRRERALGTAVRSLRARPLSERRLRERLQSRGVRPDAEEAVVGTLAEAGFVDDGRLARGRAVALAERGWGDAAVEARLAGEGLREADIAAAVAELEPETDRARPLVAGLVVQKAWVLLQRRGFDLETIECVVGSQDSPASPHTKKPAWNGFSFESGNLQPRPFEAQFMTNGPETWRMRLE
jgi:SOS response regulatory protein OraA/RecX